MRPLRRSFRGAIVVGVALLAVACGSSSAPGTSPTSAHVTLPPTVTTTTARTEPTTTTITTEPDAQTADVRVYFLHGDTLGVAHRTIAPTPAVATAAMT